MDRLESLALNNQGFVFDPATGNSFTLNHSGMLLVKGLREGLDQGDLATRLADTYTIPLEQARSDVADFIRDLARLGLA
ncbi:MAG: PqqD family protein [Planctomycetes bacterium]|nr:PqqD family protein [Planctomycetota bacterium]